LRFCSFAAQHRAHAGKGARPDRAMQVVHGYQAVPAELKGSVLTIGNFDGVHRGHQALILEALGQAERLAAKAGAMVFEPHPRAFFRPSEPYFRLTAMQQKLRLFARLGLAFTAVLNFDRALADLAAQEFIDRVLVEGFRVRHVVIGYDFFFGKGRAGTPEVMREAGKHLGFGVTVVAPVAEAGEVFSSSEIKAKIAAGDVRGAGLSLGHWWRVSGTVISGAKRGTALGFPTANVRLAPYVTLAHGIYAVRVYAGGERHLGAAYLGTRPTFDAGLPVLEVFLLDFDGDLYGREIEIEFVDFVRDDQRFPDAEGLKAQMARDCERARLSLLVAERDNPLAGLPLGASDDSRQSS
jgi:riboflavin kinase / FMN adenylyltransferase